ncbi:MAG: stage II sporulation protein R [Clostridium sp.]|nr:stage II sporulation protein R [Clostridium sp.]
MFPPLCFVDETKGDINSKELEKALIDDNDAVINDSNIKYKFKMIEVMKDILKAQ